LTAKVVKKLKQIKVFNFTDCLEWMVITIFISLKSNELGTPRKENNNGGNLFQRFLTSH
jgi:hypothetical protein